MALETMRLEIAAPVARLTFDLDVDTFRKEMTAALGDCMASDEHRRAMDAIRGRQASR